jgi:acyl-CoA reductase-like NAD-dependent aldehyde dehydrogenase
MTDFTMTIDGTQRRASRGLPVLNPATEEPIGEAPAATPEQLDEAVAAAKRSFASWRRDEGARREALVCAAEALSAQAQAIGKTLTLEQGKPLAQAVGEVMGAAAQLKNAAKQPLPHEVTRDDDKVHIEVTYRPYGVVAGITPWNFPVMMAASKIAPALLTGNTIVLKPSPFTPLSTLQLGTAIASALPAGVLNVVSGDNDVGARLTAHPDVKKISFTGSVATGKKVALAAAADLKRVTLELGGNDPAIILDDVDPAAIAPQIFWSAFMNCGQICIAVKRVYVPEAMLPALTEAVAKLAREVKVGEGIDPTTQLGPINNGMQLERVASLVADAKKHGAKVHAGGERLGRKGYFFAPTILTGVGDDVAVVAEEQFGPVLPLLPYKSVDDAVARANATHFGLGASVWSKDVARATEIGKQLDAGTVWINQHVALSPYAPFGGAKHSGIGEAGGRWGVESFMQKHVINVRKG